MVHYQELIWVYSHEETDQADHVTEIWGSSRYNLIIVGRCSDLANWRLLLVILEAYIDYQALIKCILRRKKIRLYSGACCQAGVSCR